MATPPKVDIGVLLGAGTRLSASSRSSLSHLLGDLFALADEFIKDRLESNAAGISVEKADTVLLDLTEKMMALLEDSPFTNAGRGSELTSDGRVECDASVILGGGCSHEFSASVGAVPEIGHPSGICKRLIELQSQVNETTPRSVPIFLVGNGAKGYGERLGLRKGDLTTDRAKQSLNKWKSRLLDTEPTCNTYDDRYMDTVGLIIIFRGRMCVSCSSGGSLMKDPGRVGPAALVGCGLDLNADAAAVCSGFGEDICSLRLAHKIVSSDVDLNDLELNLLKSKARLQRPPLQFGTLRATPLPGKGTLFEWYHSTASLVCGFGSVNGHGAPIYKVVDSTKPGGGGWKV